MVRIYRANTALLPDEEAVLRNIVFLDETRQQKVWQYKNLEDKKRSLLAGYLIQAGAREWTTEEGGLRENAIPLSLSYGCSKYGKPYLREGKKELYFNISHSQNYVVCAFSDSEVGVDIQAHKKGKGDIAQRFFSREDKELMEKLSGESGNAEEIFFCLWTIKESYMKLTGEGMRQGLDTTMIEIGERQEGEEGQRGQKAQRGQNLQAEYRAGILEQGRIKKKAGKGASAYFKSYVEYDEMDGYSMSICSYKPLEEIQRKEVYL